jgi:hypothetical protein
MEKLPCSPFQECWPQFVNFRIDNGFEFVSIIGSLPLKLLDSRLSYFLCSTVLDQTRKIVFLQHKREQLDEETDRQTAEQIVSTCLNLECVCEHFYCTLAHTLTDSVWTFFFFWNLICFEVDQLWSSPPFRSKHWWLFDVDALKCRPLWYSQS